MKKINICHVVSALRSGGAESMIYNYSKNMTPNDYNFYLLHQYSATKKNKKELETLNFKIKEITPKKKNIFKNYKETKKFFIQNNIDIVHAHMTLANFVPLYAAKKAGVKIRICHSHETSSSNRNIFKYIITAILKRLCVKYSTILMACGTKAGEFLYGKKNYFVYNNAIDLDKFKYNGIVRKSKREELGIDDKTIVIGHIGRFIDVKNHDFIIKIFTELVKKDKKYKLLLIGNGELENEIKEKIKINNLDDYVIMTGVIENPNDYYNVFDIFILPSKREGLPIVALEAQASGLKCLFSNTIDLNTSVVNENCQFLDLDYKQWVDIIQNVNIKYNREVKVNKYFKERNLDIENEYKKLDKLYKEKYYE